MAQILRSAKYVRCFAGVARHVLNPPQLDNTLTSNVQPIIFDVAARSASNAQLAAQQQHVNLDRSLKKLDQDVRKSGRISMRELQEVVEDLPLYKSLSTSQSLLVIRCCGNLVPEETPEVRTKLVQDIWSSLIKLNVPMDVSHYNALLRVYLENEHPFSPTEFLSDLESKGIEPNRITYQGLVARYCQLGDIEGATRILEFMKEKQLPVKENIFNALIMGHSQCGDMESAEDILSVMKKAGIEATEDTYTALLCGYAKAGDIDAIVRINDSCVSQELQFLDSNYLQIVYSLAVNGHLKHIPKVLSMIHKGFGYNQDAINIIYRLINANQDEAALMVHNSMKKNVREDGTSPPSGSFLIRQLVKAKRPIEKILEICDKFEKEGLNERGLLLATEVSLETANEELAYPLLQELKKRGREIRQHYFWPLIVAKAREDPSGDGVINVLIQMHNCNVTPTSETIRDYIIPNMRGKSSEIIGKLRQGNVSIGSSASNLAYNLLMKYDMEEAAIIISRVSAYYYPEYLRRPLTNALYKTKDYKSYVSILRNIYENFDRREMVVSEEETNLSKDDVISYMVSDLMTSKRNFLQVVDSVLSNLVEEGLSINQSTAEKLVNFLGEQLTPELSSLLDRLSSGELTMSPLLRKPPAYTPSDQMNIPQLERLISNLAAKGQEISGLKRQLLTLYCRAKNLEKTEKLIEELKSTDFTFTTGVYAQLLELYTYHEKLDKALEYYNLLNQSGTVILDDLKVIGLAGLLIKNGQFDKGIELMNHETKNNSNEDKYPYSTQCWRILNLLAEQGKDGELETLFNIFQSKGYIMPNNVMLGPMVKVHLIKNNLTKALEVFEDCCNRYKCTPFKNDLACRLIQLEDADNLQKLTDLSTMVHGEINSLYDLVFAFVECGRVRQARKILETPGLQTRPRRISTACERYQIEGMTKPLEGLKDATKDLNHIDRFDIYYQLLLSYIKQEDTEKALGLWLQMQEEDVLPTDEFLHVLGTFLEKSNIKPPFTVPKIEPPQSQIKKSTTPIQQRPPLNLSENINENKLFKESVKCGDTKTALEVYPKLKSLHISNLVFDVGLLIEQLIQNGKLQDAQKLTEDLLKQGHLLVPRIFRFLLNKLATNGEIESIERLGSYVTPEGKKLLSYDNRICHANLVAGKIDDYLNAMEREIDDAKDESLGALAEKFPRGGVLGILEKCPEFTDKFEQVAYKYAKRGIIAPINVLWSFYFAEGNREKAATLWKDYLQNSSRVMFQKVLQKARETSDEALVRDLLEHLKTTEITQGAIGNAYSCLLDVLVSKGNDEAALLTFESSLKDVTLENLNRTAIIRVKSIYDKLGKPFNYTIPMKSKQKQQTNSSSDDESTHKSNAAIKLV